MPEAVASSLVSRHAEVAVGSPLTDSSGLTETTTRRVEWRPSQQVSSIAQDIHAAVVGRPISASRTRKMAVEASSAQRRIGVHMGDRKVATQAVEPIGR